MTELYPITRIHSELHEHGDFVEQSVTKFNQYIDAAQAEIRDIAANADHIREVASDMIVLTSLRPTFFDDPKRSIIFTALADKLSKTEPNDEPTNEFINSSLTLLGHAHSDALAKVYGANQLSEEEVPESEQLAVYDKYTDKKMSSELVEAINSGLLADVKKRMGITDESEKPYEVRVLSIGDEQLAYGMTAPRIDWDNMLKE